MLFFRDIGYLDNYCNGLRCRTVGSVKIQMFDNNLSVELHGRLQEKDERTLAVYLMGNKHKKKIASIQVKQGNIHLSMKGISLEKDERYEDFWEVYIPIKEGCYLSAIYREAPAENSAVTSEKSDREFESFNEEKSEQTVECKLQSETQNQGDCCDESEQEVQNEENKQTPAVSARALREKEAEHEMETEQKKDAEPETEPESKMEEETEPEPETEPESAPTNNVPVEKPESKWENLYMRFPKRIPFQDDRRFLELKPEDMIFLSERNYAFSVNPFLLYGYKQYGHLILGRIGQGKYHAYRLGVPGVYHHKEVQAALHYGFDSFESLDKNEREASEGRRGYYFTTVNL